MAYDSIVSRGDVPISEDYAAQIIDNATDQSAAMSLFRQVRLSKAQQRFPVLSALPTAYWVNGDTGLKQTTEMAWANKYLNVEEIAAIVPVPENVISDSDFDIWGEVRPKIETAIARTLDAAVFFGTNAPSSFPTAVVPSARAAGNSTTAAAALDPKTGGIFGALDGLIGQLETDGYEPTGYLANRAIRGLFRSARNANGERLDRDRLSAGLDELDGDPISYSMRGMWDANLLAIAGQWDSFVLGIRQDMTYKILDQAVIQDNTGKIVYNLAQQDMVALRVTFRAGWQVANPINYDNAGAEATRYPAAVLERAAA